MQESFNQHLKDIVDCIVDCIITDLNIELKTQPAAYHNEHAMFYMPETRTFTYEGRTKSDKWFRLIISE